MREPGTTVLLVTYRGAPAYSLALLSLCSLLVCEVLGPGVVPVGLGSR